MEAKKLNEEGTKKKFLPPRKHINIPKRATNMEDFKKMFYAESFSNIITKMNF